ncbi:hypothetical protein TrVE_jg6062 [Triparma verrucosa]|uniref:Uncharacterized protein n=1 Tax=Triparma verrucosa TaxID=1606542 RepID=A0A9W7C3A2_9STRA|nr:hypothetical protein TrVE_jg6062 [Triparma verrucosa]
MVFTLVLNRSHLHTFYNFDTASDWTTPWTLKNWDRWEEEKPAWFTDTWIDNVPNNYIPYDWRVKYNKTKGRVDDPKQRRRSSVQQVKMLMGGEAEK